MSSVLLAPYLLILYDSCPNQTSTYVQYSGYSEDAILPIATIMLNYLLQPIKHENFHKKYSLRRFYKVAQFVYSWTRERWSEGDTVDLVDRLSQLRRTGQGFDLVAAELEQ